MNFINKQKIDGLKLMICKSLTSLVDRDFVLLDIPNHRNIGDTLIWEGELAFFKEVPFKMLYSCNEFTYSSKKVPENAIIFLHGGGNFGDVWRKTQEFRNGIIKEKTNQRIVIFPQTVHYGNESLLLEDAKLYNLHPDLTICARDQRSFEILSKYFTRCKILLLPDMAFCLDFSNYINNQVKKKALLLKRLDKEIKINQDESILNLIGENGLTTEIKDWPGFFETGTLKRKVQGYVIRIETSLSKTMMSNTFFRTFVDDVYGLKRRDNKERLILKGINFINQYDEIYSTRLHGFILAVLLDKKVSLIDNSYGKNSSFYNSWMSDFDNVKLIP